MSPVPETPEKTPSALNQILDVDAHEFAPPHLWGETFGPVAGRLAPVCEPFAAAMGEGYIVRPDLAGDVMDMTAENVWHERTTSAPGAFDMGRRLEAMDLMGVKRQLIFPSYALFAQMLVAGSEGGGALAESMHEMLKGDMSPGEARQLGLDAIDEYNEWAISVTGRNPDRLRPVGILKQADGMDALMAQAGYLIDSGLRGILIDIGTPPAGVSPAAREFDRFWTLLADNDVPALAHVGGDLGFLRSSQWSNAEAFEPSKTALELGFEPYSYATLHLSVEHWLTVMVLGGVFERIPRLRFGAIELGAHWLGPLADNLDMWATTVFKRRIKSTLSRLPSEYLARNVRVTPHNIIEPMDKFITGYPHLASCYCFSTDYPHLEGGADIKNRVFEQLKPLGCTTLEKYFVTNGEWLLPE